MLGFVSRNSSPIRGLEPRRIARGLLAISPQEAEPRTRGFDLGSTELEDRLRRVGHTFLHGYHAALEARDATELVDRLDGVEHGWRGFAYEGAGMGLALLDVLFPRFPGRRRRSRLGAFLDGPAEPHRFLVIVGAGWTLARVPRRIATLLGRFDPVLAWLCLDGYGFHHGYFSWPRSVSAQRRPRRLRGYAGRAFDQGLGRSLWFVKAASPRRIAATIERFPEKRRGDLWSGVGLACAYAGGVERSDVVELRTLAGDRAAHLAQGAAFAARARWEAGEVTPATELACQVLCASDPATVAVLTRTALESVTAGDGDHAPRGHGEPTYESWRREVRGALGDAVTTPGAARAAG